LLARESRLITAEDFRSTMRNGQKANASHLVVYLNRDESNTQARFGFVVGKLVGGAVQRNLVKRRLRSAVRSRLETFSIDTSMVIRGLPGLAEITWDELNAELDLAIAGASKTRIK
jgi:ribonuclease P protein component